ncbi:ATP-binding protein [Fibrella sp. WM1]|uniref:PAS domain-containing sensor histidine kinase n=1 Tax=Fibrella musci TaxID=3242485 RepID=UPI0035208A93
MLPDAPRFTIVAATDAYLEVTHASWESIQGKGLFEVFTGEGASRQAIGVESFNVSLQHVVHHKQTHQTAEIRYDILDPSTGNLQERIWKVINQPVLNEHGDLRYILNTVEDITQAVQLVEVTKANRYLQDIINGFTEPLQVLQPVIKDGKIIDFRFKLVNQAYASYAKATPDQLHGRLVGDVFPGYVDTVSFTNPVETYETGEPLTFEIHYDKDGLDLYNRMTTYKLDEEVVIHFTDFTRERQLQRQLESKVDELERSNANLQQFAYVASHDLQEPLRKIRSFGDLLYEQYGTYVPDTGQDLLQRMQSAANRMQTLIRALLDYSRITTQQPIRQPVSLSIVVQTVLSELDMIIEQTNALVEMHELPTVQGDASQLGQLFQNLLTNALKFRQLGIQPHLVIDGYQMTEQELPSLVRPAQCAAVYHVVTVRDNGIGFDPKYSERIFQMFQRLHGKSQYEGTGIGLAICQQVATSHGGAITAQSQPGKGTTFALYLPCVD